MKLLCFIALFFVTPVFAGVAIIDGRDANKGEFPSVISLEIFEVDQLSLCTATFISDNTLITAAHCVYQKNYNDIILPPGAKIKNIVIHDAYARVRDSEYLKLAYDIALIILDQSVKTPIMGYTNQVQTGEAIIVGYGGKNKLTRAQLNLHMDESIGIKRIGKTEIKKISPLGRIDSAKRVFKSKNWISFTNPISVSTRGDSGGPLIQNGKIVGIISASDVSHQSETTIYSMVNYFSGLHSSLFGELRETAKIQGSSIR